MAPARRSPARSPAAKRAPAKRAPAKKAPAKKKTGSRGPGIGQGKRGQRLSAGAGAYESSNIGGVQPTGVAYGAYDSGTSLEQVKRNEWLNSLSLEDRSFAMNQMGYFTGGVPTGTPKVSSKTLRAYGKAIKASGWQGEGTFEYEARPGVRAGQIRFDAAGNMTVDPYRADADGRAGRGGGKGVVKAGTTRPKKLTAKAKRPGSPGGKKVTAKERARIKKAKTKARGKGKGGGGGGGATEEEEETFNPYAEADTSTTAYRRAQGKAYGRGQGESRAGQTESPVDSTVVEEAASGGGGRRRRRRAKKLTTKAKRPGSPGGRRVTPRERKRIQRARGK